MKYCRKDLTLILKNSRPNATITVINRKFEILLRQNHLDLTQSTADRCRLHRAVVHVLLGRGESVDLDEDLVPSLGGGIRGGDCREQAVLLAAGNPLVDQPRDGVDRLAGGDRLGFTGRDLRVREPHRQFCFK